MSDKPLFERLVDRGATVVVTILLTGATWFMWETVMDFRDTKRGLEATQEVLGKQIAELSDQVAKLYETKDGGGHVKPVVIDPNLLRQSWQDIEQDIYKRKAEKK
jgi:H2-forming N5,N10-methylenetetrahydromethanopterin dehydrogenase-like enzyme